MSENEKQWNNNNDAQRKYNNNKNAMEHKNLSTVRIACV